MRARLIQAVLSRDFGKTDAFLKGGAFNVNDVDYQITQRHLHDPNLSLALSSIVHIAASTNNPKILWLLIKEYGANIRQIEQQVQSKFLSVLINRAFNTNVSTASALNNLDILFRSGAAMPESVVQQLIIDFDHMPECRDNLQKIIKKLHILKATLKFLDHVRNNQINEARHVRTTNIRVLYPYLQRLGISGYINPNYDAGVHGMATLIAAGLPNTQMLTSLRERPLPWLTETDFSLSNAEGLTLLHILAMTGDLHTLHWVFDTLSKDQLLHLLTKKVTRPDGQQYTPMALAILYNHPAIANFYRTFAQNNNDFVFTQIRTENPNKLRSLYEVGFQFNRVHTTTLGNSLHYAVLGIVPANLRWIWSSLSTIEKVHFLLSKMQYTSNGAIDLVSPLQLAQRLGRNNIVRILQGLAVELAGLVNPLTLRELISAGYNMNCTDSSQPNALYYAVLGNRIDNIALLLQQRSIIDIVTLLNTKMSFINQPAQHIGKTLIEVAETLGSPAIVSIFRDYQQLAADFNEPQNSQGGLFFGFPGRNGENIDRENVDPRYASKRQRMNPDQEPPNPATPLASAAARANHFSLHN